MIRRPSPAFRRMILGGAFLAAALVALLPDLQNARAADASDGHVLVLSQNDAKAEAKAAAEEAAETAQEAARNASDVARDAAAAAKAATRDARRAARDADTDADTYDDGTQRKHHRGITIGVGGMDREYDSFDQFLDRDPALASMVLGIVFIVFLTPILIIALVIWYKVRKTRMQNETMLKLAEKGFVPPGEALQAIGTGQAATVIGSAAASAPLAEQAKALRRQAAWSDLRKGVLMGTVGLALTFYSVFDDRSPNWLGLVLLFVGIGYCVLWYFEDQQMTALRSPGTVPTQGPGDLHS
ncbi:MAG: DUF6249 domain-containing protein [Casimicrobiaceae bacterium]